MSWGPMQILLVLVIVLLLFGTKKLRNFGGDLGSAIKGFKRSMAEEDKPGKKEEGDAVAKSGADKHEP